MYYVGLDAHWKTSTICILDDHGREIKTETFPGTVKNLLWHIARLPRPFAICFEASCTYGYLYDQLCKMAQRVVVAHPGQLRLIFRSKRKNDRVDARKLAKLLFLDEVPPVYVPSQDVRQWRSMIEFRQKVIGRRTACKNQIRALLRGLGQVAPKGLWTLRGRVWLTKLNLPAGAALRLDMLVDELGHHNVRIRRITEYLDRIAAKHPSVTLLRTIPGVGPRTAEAIVAYMGQPARFGRARQVGAYFGLVPCQDSSAGAARLGHITREGPATARKLLVEATWQAKRHCVAVQARFDRTADGKADRRKIALVGTAHWLIRCMWAMLMTGQGWRPAA